MYNYDKSSKWALPAGSRSCVLRGWLDTSEESVHAHRVSRSALRTHWGRFGSEGLLDTECELRTKKKKLHVAQDGLYILWFWRGRERESNAASRRRRFQFWYSSAAAPFCFISCQHGCIYEDNSSTGQHGCIYEDNSLTRQCGIIINTSTGQLGCIYEDNSSPCQHGCIYMRTLVQCVSMAVFMRMIVQHVSMAVFRSIRQHRHIYADDSSTCHPCWRGSSTCHPCWRVELFSA